MKKVIVLIFLLGLTGFLLAYIPGDIDSSGCVDVNDLVIFSSAWLSDNSPSANWNPACDIPDANDGIVNGLDFAILAKHWLGIGMIWVHIDNDPGVSGHEGFDGYMSKYETTNAQYCQYLNAAEASGDITVSDNYVVGTSGPYSGQNYYNLAGPGYTVAGATKGGAARINWTGSVFTVDSGFENHPVTYVSWYGSMAFASYYGWRLPTEWEWQAVADYTGGFTYGCGTTINNSIANYYNSVNLHGTTAVGSFGTYGYGMADMAGNVLEWTSSINNGSYCVFRGGGWLTFDIYCTVSRRNLNYLDYTSYYYGFRVCR